MARDDDFTFCQVGVPTDQDGLESQKVVIDISSVIIKDNSANVDSPGGASGITWENKLPSDGPPKKQATVGSLSFNVTDMSPGKRLSGNQQEAASGEVGSSAKISLEQRFPNRKPAPRAKVPFEKGYSQMDWLKLTQTQPDLAGLKGQSNKRLISLYEVKQHQTGNEMWTVLKGRVYNIAPYMKFHPGGVDMLMKAVGKDCTSLFNKYHAWVNAEFLLEKCLIGILDDTK